MTRRSGYRWRQRSGTRHHEPLVREMLALFDADPRSMQDIAVKSGVALTTISTWRRARSPHVHLILALLNALGYTLKIVKIPETTITERNSSSSSQSLHSPDKAG